MKNLLKICGIAAISSTIFGAANAAAPNYQNAYGTPNVSTKSPEVRVVNGEQTQEKKKVAQKKSSAVVKYIGVYGLGGYTGWTNEYSGLVCDPTNPSDCETRLSSEDLSETAFGLGASFGISQNNLRGELEFNYLFPYTNKFVGNNYKDEARNTIAHTYDSFEYSTYTFMLNGYYDFKDEFESITPYLGAGFGINIGSLTQSLDTDNTTQHMISIIKKNSQSSYRLGINLMAGFSFRVENGFYLDAGYKFSWASKAAFVQEIEYTDTNISKTVTGELNEDIKGDMRHYLRLGFRFEL
jgi:opacity protein-like surface antigen